MLSRQQRTLLHANQNQASPWHSGLAASVAGLLAGPHAITHQTITNSYWPTACSDTSEQFLGRSNYLCNGIPSNLRRTWRQPSVPHLMSLLPYSQIGSSEKRGRTAGSNKWQNIVRHQRQRRKVNLIGPTDTAGQPSLCCPPSGRI